MIAGLAGQGKSTLLQHLIETGQIPDTRRAAHADSDFIKQGLVGYERGLGTSAVHRQSTVAQKEVINEAQKRGMDIVSEGIGVRWAEYKTTQDPGYKKVMHVAYTPLDIAEKRVAKRNQQGGRQIPLSLVRQKADWLYGNTLSHLSSGLGELYIWDTDVPENTPPKIIAKVIDGQFEVFDEKKFKEWTVEHGGSRGGDSNLAYWRSKFPRRTRPGI
jgi:predicted ABC-type ATPase